MKRGDHVTYEPYKGCPRDQLERGIVKRVDEDGAHVFVLYHTRGKIFEEHDLDHYTAARTRIADLLQPQHSTTET